jgi:hypothetical protein
MDTNQVVPDGEAPEESWFVPRPTAVLLDLSVAHRWEVTRRHPYYLRFWELARAHYERPAACAPGGPEWSAALLLQAIGVGNAPPPPGDSAESLGALSLAPGWESGAVAPVTFRGLLGLIMSGLPPELLAQVGRFLAGGGTTAGSGPEAQYTALSWLSQLKHPALEAFPPRPVVGVNISAPQRVIVEAVEYLVRGWKEQQGIPERRRREDKLDDYLAVWDLRESWTGDRYDTAGEQSLREISQHLQIPLSTAANRYRSAFRLIIGRDYSPSLWARVLGFLKVADRLERDQLPRRSLRRPWRDRQPRPVPESVLQPPGAGAGAAGLLNTAGAGGDEVAYVELVLDVQDLIEQGRSNREIVAALEMNGPEAEGAVEFLRRRREDLL